MLPVADLEVAEVADVAADVATAAATETEAAVVSAPPCAVLVAATETGTGTQRHRSARIATAI